MAVRIEQAFSVKGRVMGGEEDGKGILYMKEAEVSAFSFREVAEALVQILSMHYIVAYTGTVR
ncbi:MAG: hypothetical protein M1837_004090 [Sclerophora amabilis]|nr:MAG: hypothetical protein M1837_004090 [Sclerophora amabilis]